MIIKECIFNGLILECSCGKTEHVAFTKLHSHACGCGRTLSMKMLKSQGVEEQIPNTQIAANCYVQ